MRSTLKILALACLVLAPASGPAWGNKGHEIINFLAWRHIPAAMPAFVRSPAAAQQIEYLGPEPDRWRSSLEPELAGEQGPEHYIDLEWADRLGQLPRQRWQYVRALYAYGARHPEQAAEMVPEKIGLQPWQVVEAEQRLQAAFREWRHLTAAHRNTAASEQAALFYMGWLGHYVGDGSQPLHTTYRFNGWIGDDPQGFSTERGIHSRFETEFVNHAMTEAQVDRYVTPAPQLDDVFAQYLQYLRQSQALVETTYALDKINGFSGAGTAESREFTAKRLAAAVTMLDSLWLTAWENSSRQENGD